MNKKLMTAALMAAFMAGCTQDEPAMPPVDSNEVRLTARVNALTRATATAFEATDSIGLYAMAWTDATPSVQLPLAAPYYAGNMKYEWDGTGFAPQGTAIYWPIKSRKLDFYAYYPYSSAGIADDGRLGVTVETNQSIGVNHAKSDVMTARLTGNERTKEALVLPFRHAMSKLRFVLTPGEGYTDTELAALTLTLKQMKTTAWVDLSKTSAEEGYMTGADTPADIAVTATREAIVVPQTKATGEVLFALTDAVGATLVSYVAEEGKNSFETGKQYNYTVKISRVGMNLQAEIADWEVVEFTEISNDQVIDLDTDIGGTEGEKAETFAEGDVVGLFQKNGEVMGEVNQAFTWTAGKPVGKMLCWPDGGTRVTFYSYFPYTAGLTSTSLPVKVAKDQSTAEALSGSDVKTAVLTTDKSTTGKVTLTFEHAFAKINVRLAKGVGFTDAEIAGMRVTMPGMMTTGAIDLTKIAGEPNYLLNVGGAQEVVPFRAEGVAMAIVVPQTKAVGDALFAIKTAAGVPVASYGAEAERNVFESGKQYAFTLTMNRVGITVSAEISNWQVVDFAADAEPEMELSGDIGGTAGEAEETFATGDEVGVYVRFGEAMDKANAKFTWGAGGFAGVPVYWPERGTVVDVFAYYPYKATAGVDISALKVEAAADQTVDVAYAASDVKIAKLNIPQFTSGKVVLPFVHALSRMKVTLAAGEGYAAADLEGCTVQIENMYASATLNMSKTPAEWITACEGSQTVKMHPNKGAVVIPRTVTVGDALFTVYDSEGTKMVVSKAVANKNVFESGSLYSITLTVKKAGMNVSATITGWTEQEMEMDGDQWLD